ncbi:MAG: hypothetical protein K6F14_08060 [Clostridiales bacterium]|nr:hypothetical protein [Clostridiales bacterium]
MTSSRKKRIYKIISLVLAIIIMMGVVPANDLFGGLFSLFSLDAHAEELAEAEEKSRIRVIKPSILYDPVNSVDTFSGNTIYLTNTTMLVDYSYYYNNTDGFAASHCNDTLIFAFTGGSDISEDFVGLGTSAHPFAGTLRFGGANYGINAHSSLFNYVYDSVKLLNDGDSSTENVVFQRLSDAGSSTEPIFAHYVLHDTSDGATSAQWNITLSSASVKTYSGVIGEIQSGAAVDLTYTNNSSAAVESASNVGAVCGTMQDGSSLTLSYTAANSFSITTSGGDAGSLVGEMNGNASLTLVSIPTLSNAVTASGYAGGLVGETTSNATISYNSGIVTLNGSVTGVSGAGGVFGHYTNYSNVFDLNNFNNTATVFGQYCGGVFGVLENDKNGGTATALTIRNTSSAGTLNIQSGTGNDYSSNGYFGGIAGKYITDDLENSLILNGLTITADDNTQFNSFGGAIGIADSIAYISTTDTLTVNATGTAASTYFGGLVGTTSKTYGVFVDLGNFTLSNNSESFKGGGVVGCFNNGILRLSGTTDLTGAKCACAENCGQLVGKNDNVLTYALGNGSTSGWILNRYNGSQADDLGTWGEVVRISGIETNILTFNSTAHTVTVGAADTSMSSAADFALTALNIQLNQGNSYDCLLFTAGDSNTRSTLLAGDLSITDDISLVGSGITGFMRDGGTVSNIGSYTGTLEGNSKTITLASGETYGVVTDGQTEGKGQIYRHQHNGLFAVLAGTIQNITISGSIDVHNCVDGMNVGGIASRNSGNVTLTGINVSETINYCEDSGVTGTADAGKNIGGMIGFIGTSGTVTINGNSIISASINMSGYHQSWNVYGGAIGKITAESFTITVGASGNKLTCSIQTDVSGITAIGDNSESSGLIGYITANGSYSSRIVNVNNLEFDGCIISNAANNYAGGFLGYSWLNTTANIKGLTIKSGTINNCTIGGTTGGNGNVGVLCYSATGKWVVDSLNMNSFTVSGGCGTSVGLIVNKAYSGNDGLYLDVLNSGYTLNGSGIKLPSSLGVYDEIAAYSASNVQNGGNGTGVVSINMNDTRNGSKTKITETGTYQNKLTSTSSAAITTSKYANSNTRYYYNIDDMTSSDGGENLILWSLNKYAASNIKGEFLSTLSNTLSGTADMTGLSFYPLAYAGNYTIGDLTLTFDYSGLYETAEGTFGAHNPTDSYNRVPALSNQHYLMHSGLFINQSAGNTLTVSGDMSVGGTFMEDSTHKGVLFSGVVRGTVDGSNGSITFSGLVPHTTGNSTYSDGYLLINKIERNDNKVAPPDVHLNGLSTTGYGSATLPVAASLIGDAYGKGLKIAFSSAKLDARTTSIGTGNDALTTAYGTSRSIFKNAVFLNSIYTDQDAHLVYNYTYEEDWGSGNRSVTYGQEIKTSTEYADQEKQYSGDNRCYTYPVSSTAQSSDPDFAFDSYFLKYVNTAYNSTKDSDGRFYRELKVNVVAEGLTDGCGTYNDPYIITSGSQFEAVAAFINNGDPDSLGKIRLPKDSSQFDTLDENITGARWCTGDSYHADYVKNDDISFKPDTDNTASDWTVTNVQYYLVNAYYKINTDLELSDTYVGLGGKTSNTAFRGVIIGNSVTINNKSSNPFINVSNGCVVKNITIVVDNGGFTLNQANCGNDNAYFGYNSMCQYYGGIIGEIMGGDNIIDNCYVRFNNSTITLSGTYGTIVPVGGYVGVIVFGGLIFKNMSADQTTISETGLNVVYTGKTYNLADNSDVEAWAAIYVNPLVGRVINGYAVNETGENAKDSEGNIVQQFSVSEDGKYHDKNGTSRSSNQHTLKNSKKHYTISDIDPDMDKLDVTSIPTDTNTDGNINIPNSQALFILSLITQSCAGTAATNDGNYNNSLSYGINNNNVFGMCHGADYSYVGNAGVNNENADYVLASKDTADNSAVPYIIKYYTTYTSTPITETTGQESRGDIFYPDNIDDLDGKELYIYNENPVGESNRRYLLYTAYNTNLLNKSASIDDATVWHFEKYTDNIFYVYSLSQGTSYYLNIDKNGLRTVTEKNNASKFEIIKVNPTLSKKSGFEKTFALKCNGYYMNQAGNLGGKGYGSWNGNGESNYFTLALTEDKAGETIIVGYNYGYSARCVTSTIGYYDINLTANVQYVLPDSFRGIGSVGIYDTHVGANNTQIEPGSNNNTIDGYYDRNNNQFSMKIDMFNGNSKSIDVDIYLNKYQNDNYFNVLHKGTNQSTNENTAGFSNNDNTCSHGIGLFDSVVTKNSNSSFKDFTLKGSVNTEIFNNSYKQTSEKQKITGADSSFGKNYWLSTGGVCGWAINGEWIKFSNIELNNLSVRGASTVGGLLGYSGNKSKTYYIIIDRCNAASLDVELTACQKDVGRHGIGAFVGKVKEGGVRIYGTESEKSNTDYTKFSTVELRSFSCVNSTTVVAGGLVGYAGNGCQAYDMHLLAKSGCNVTIGNSNVLMSGGIVGLMQPVEAKLSDCIAEFVNCTIAEININARQYAGGLYGGTWNTNPIEKFSQSINDDWTVYKNTIKNCKMIGNSTSNNTIIATNGIAGGFVADGFVIADPGEGANIEIANSLISNYTIEGQGSSKASAGGFIGYANANGTNSVVCYIHDSSVEDCTLGSEGKYAGGAVGEIAQNTENKLLGYNVKLKNIEDGTIDDSDKSYLGAWIGKAKGDADGMITTIQFTGMAIYGTGFTKNIGNNATLNNASFVFADYTDGSVDMDTDNEKVSGFNYSSETHVDMPKYPYVNVNPQSNMGSDEIISGDGAVLGESVSGFSGKTSATTIAAKIYSDIAAGTDSRRYTTFDNSPVNGVNTIKYYLDRLSTDEGNRISTYGTEKGSLPAGVEDFAVIVITNDDATETTNLINRYIQLVTNTETDYTASNEYYSVAVETCKYTNGNFTIDAEATSHGLTYTEATESSNRSFTLNNSCVDSSEANTFTLVDVQFKDPLDSTKIVYHLYVPVYTVKQIEVNFYSAVKTGSDSVSYTDCTPSTDYSSLMSSNGKHVDSLETWITQYIRFSYSEEELNILLNGNNVDWNNNKSAVFRTYKNSTTFKRLPEGTFMVLVDPNGSSDKMYYVSDMNGFTTYEDPENENANREGWVIDFSVFKDSNNEAFSVRTINNLIASVIVETTEGENLVYTDGTEADHDVYRILENGTKKYYKYNGNGEYNLSVPEGYDLNEDYYISMYIPMSTDLYFYEIKAPSSLEGGKNVKVNEGNVFTVIAADLYKQTTNDFRVLPDNQEISAANKTITMTTSVSIEISNADAKAYLSDVSLYHSFDFSLNRHYEDGSVLNDIYGLTEGRVTATYSIGSEADENSTAALSKDLQDNYLNIETADIMSDLLSASQSGNALRVYGYVELNFDETALETEFPPKESDSIVGMNVSATSNLAYEEGRLAYTSMSKSFAADSHYYYRESDNSALLDYVSVTELDEYDTVGKNSQNHSRLGLNGYATDCYQKGYMPINTEAKYNASVLSAASIEKAEYVRLTISLSKKTDNVVNGEVTSVEYSEVSDLLSYMASSVQITSGTLYNSTHTITSGNSVLVVDIPKASCLEESGLYSFGLDFGVKTGTGFTEYANYMITLRVELIYTENEVTYTVENSGVSDYIIYTNAKVVPNVIEVNNTP